MATTTVSSILSKATIILQDTGNIRWTTAELLGWLNDGQREIVLLKPNANTKRAVVQLTAGVRQTLPTDAISLVHVVSNYGTDGLTVGKSIWVVSHELMDQQNPSWRSSIPSATVKHYMYSDQEPEVFYVYPPQPATGTGYVEVVYTAIPTNATTDGTITINDVYMTPLLNYVLYRAYGKDSEFAASQSLSSAYYQQFINLLTGKVQAEQISNPNLGLGVMNPATGGSLK